MYIKGGEIVDEMRNKLSIDPNISKNEVGERIAWDLTCISMAHLGNYIQQVYPTLKPELLKICCCLADLELADRAIKNGMAPLKTEQGINLEIDPFTEKFKNLPES